MSKDNQPTFESETIRPQEIKLREALGGTCLQLIKFREADDIHLPPGSLELSEQDFLRFGEAYYSMGVMSGLDSRTAWRILAHQYAFNIVNNENPIQPFPSQSDEAPAIPLTYVDAPDFKEYVGKFGGVKNYAEVLIRGGVKLDGLSLGDYLAIINDRIQNGPALLGIKTVMKKARYTTPSLKHVTFMSDFLAAALRNLK